VDLMDGIKGKRSIQKYKPDPVPTHGPMELVGNLIKLGKTPAAIRIPGPEFSQHTEEILLELGYTWEDIDRFKELKVIA
jgi:crotonobetainyl-CoA:carnitine CoA-transferase CaiB-like acyl-CoA transferase